MRKGYRAILSKKHFTQRRLISRGEATVQRKNSFASLGKIYLFRKIIVFYISRNAAMSQRFSKFNPFSSWRRCVAA